MAEAAVIAALRDKRSELADLIQRLEHELAARRGDLLHVAATLRLFAPAVAADAPAAETAPVRNAWFRQGECLRLIYDVLRGAPGPMVTRAIAEHVMTAKGIAAADERTRDLIQKTILGSLNRTPEIERVRTGGVVAWRVI